MSSGRSIRVSQTFTKTEFDGIERTKSIISVERYHRKAKIFLLSLDDHLLSNAQLITKYSTDLENGLTQKQAKEFIVKYGPNALAPVKPKSRLLILFSYLFGGFSALLWLGAVLTFTAFTVVYFKNNILDMDQMYIGIVLTTVVLITGIFGYHQEASNVSLMEGFKRMLPRNANVIRDGKQFEIPSEDLVIGDIIKIRAGDLIPADVRLLNVVGLRVDNSSFTGECEPQPRTVEMTDKNPLESGNLAFFGTHAIDGKGRGIVIATGSDTLMGHIAELTADIEPEDTIIKRELNHFIHVITGIAMTLGGTCLIMAVMRGYNFIDAFVFFIAIVVANVPEGLLVTMTASLTLTAKRMAEKNCLVKNLHAIETLGATTVICSDKTGTLTQNKMTVAHIYYNKNVIGVMGEEIDIEPVEAFQKLCRVGMLCNNTVVTEDKQLQGDPSEKAIIACMEKLIGKIQVHEERLQNPKMCEIPFNSTTKFQVSVHRDPRGNFFVAMKGAPEVILERCSTMLFGTTNTSINRQRKDIEKAVLEMGYRGERVLGFADFDLSPSEFPVGYHFDDDAVNFPLQGLRLVGFMAMIDPPKPNVLEAIQRCKTAGIRVVMVTGDHPVTAVAIAKQVGIISPDRNTIYDIAIQKNIGYDQISVDQKELCTATVITGKELLNMTNLDLDYVIEAYDEIVFSRTTPQQKLQIVEAFQRMNEVVAVTGDGVNDSPALKKADIGVAMGISGSDVSKDAADMIILDDNFSTIVNGIEEGRIIFDNLKKSIAFLLTTNVPGLLPFILLIILNLPPALSVMAILIIDVGTDLWPGVSFAYEQGEYDIMYRKPRNINTDKLVNLRLILFTYLQMGVVQACAGYTAYFYTMARHGFLYDNLLNTNDRWKSRYCNDLEDSFGQEWTYDERKILERKGYAAFFWAMVTTQIADAIICKNRRLSIVDQKMKNWVLNFGLMFMVVLGIVVVYCPYVNTVAQFEPIELVCILVSLPFAAFIFVFDEARRYIIRKYPDSWLARETYF